METIAGVMEARAKLARLGALLFDRRLTDACGGNMSVRVGDLVCLTPSLSGSKHQWQLEPEEVLVVDFEGNILEGEGTLSREINVHFKLHREFGGVGNAVIHAHPRNLMVFAAMAVSMPPVLEATLKFGEVKCLEYAPAHSQILADTIAEALRGQEDRIAKQAAGVIASWHGLFLMGKDLDAAFDAVERFDTNAYCILMAQQALGGEGLLSRQREALAASRRRFQAS
ncbi:MAG: class II aldolase/adducin family protein [Trueperaceae bacterium]|nr:MAG: class II aldolase/adducin family protein [Trueperaceae bacterium]